jgi:hypothetical protein
MAHDDSNYLVLRLGLCFGKIRPLADQKNPELCHLDTPKRPAAETGGSLNT